MNPDPVSPVGLLIRLAIYFAVLFSALVITIVSYPQFVELLPIGGTDAIEVARIEIEPDSISLRRDSLEDAGDRQAQPVTAKQAGRIILFLSFSLLGTLIVMLPITWTYIATKREVGYRKSFVRALLILPICATTIVLLIQDSLALAFGLAAMVAAVRFRVALQEAIDGIYIFAAICVGLAAGIGYLGIATLMATFFAFTNATLWLLDYGRNPVDDAEHAKKMAKLDKQAAEPQE